MAAQQMHHDRVAHQRPAANFLPRAPCPFEYAPRHLIDCRQNFALQKRRVFLAFNREGQARNYIRAVRALRRLINTQISALLWLRDSTGKTITPEFSPDHAQAMTAALEQAAMLLETQPAPLAAIDAIATARNAAAGWGHAEEILGNIGLALQAHFVAASDLTLPAHHRARQLPVVLHSDWVGARRAMLRAFSSIFLVGLIWVVTGWHGGAYMLLGLSVMITVFSSFENPAFTMRFVILGQAMGAGVALACQWFAWPFANSQLQMVLMMLPFIFLGALLLSHRRTTLYGFDCNMVILLALSPHFPYQLDVGHSLSMAFAIVTGPLADPDGGADVVHLDGAGAAHAAGHGRHQGQAGTVHHAGGLQGPLARPLRVQGAVPGAPEGHRAPPWVRTLLGASAPREPAIGRGPWERTVSWNAAALARGSGMPPSRRMPSRSASR